MLNHACLKAMFKQIIQSLAYGHEIDGFAHDLLAKKQSRADDWSLATLHR